MNSDHVIKEDNHSEDIELMLDRLERLTRKEGVLHLGAHQAEEVPHYLKRGFQKVALIEANPILATQISDQYKDQANVETLNYAVCDKLGTVDLHIHMSNSGVESSSLFQMDKLDKIVSSLRTTETVNVSAVTIDHLFETGELVAADYNVLVSDIQGADYLAILGAKNAIANFDAVVVEVQCIELYESYVSEEQMNELLESMGFVRDFTIYHELFKGDDRFVAWGEAIYFKKIKCARPLLNC